MKCACWPAPRLERDAQLFAALLLPVDEGMLLDKLLFLDLVSSCDGPSASQSLSDGVEVVRVDDVEERITAHGWRVRKTGLPSSNVLGDDAAEFGLEVCFGSVRAQFSHGMARFLSDSSYVLLNPESLSRALRGICPLFGASAAILGEAGGVWTGSCGSLRSCACDGIVSLAFDSVGSSKD